MPRDRKGQLYPNRSDLATQPVSVPTGGTYGSGKASADAQKVLPLPQTKPPTGASVAGAQADPFAAALQTAQGMEFQPVGIGSPSARPNEPITAGLPVGPGPGPEMLRRIQPRARASDTFRLLADVTGDPEFERLAVDADDGGF